MRESVRLWNRKHKEDNMKYRVIDTPCWPDRWKVVPIGNYRESNALTNYFPSLAAAQAECIRREKKELDSNKLSPVA